MDQSIRGQINKENPYLLNKYIESIHYFGNVCMNPGQALYFVQETPESKQKPRIEILRIMKGLEGNTDKLKVALDHANNTRSETQKASKGKEKVGVMENCVNS